MPFPLLALPVLPTLLALLALGLPAGGHRYLRCHPARDTVRRPYRSALPFQQVLARPGYLRPAKVLHLTPALLKSPPVRALIRAAPHRAAPAAARPST